MNYDTLSLIFGMLPLGSLFNVMLTCKWFCDIGRDLISENRQVMSYTWGDCYNTSYYLYKGAIHGLMRTIVIGEKRQVGTVIYHLGDPFRATGKTTGMCSYGYSLRYDECSHEDFDVDELEYEIKYLVNSVRMTIRMATNGEIWDFIFHRKLHHVVDSYINYFQTLPYGQDRLGFGYPSNIHIRNLNLETIFEYIRMENYSTEVELFYYKGTMYNRTVAVQGRIVEMLNDC
jgi:hypothetical protein